MQLSYVLKVKQQTFLGGKTLKGNNFQIALTTNVDSGVREHEDREMLLLMILEQSNYGCRQIWDHHFSPSGENGKCISES